MITSSTATATSDAQVDGRFWVHEEHTDDHGVVTAYDYLADKGTDYLKIATDRAAALNAAEADLG